MLCPQKGCGKEVEEGFVKRHVSEVVFNKWKEFKRNNQVLLDQEKRFCPNPKCKDIVVTGSKDTMKIKCHQCKENFCF